MKKTSQSKKKRSSFFYAFLAVALAFLAVGLGTLGSVFGTGSAYELRAKQTGDSEVPHVDFHLTGTVKEGDTTTNLRLVGVYVNIAAIYAEPGNSVTLRVERSSNGTSFSSGINAVIENYYTPTADVGEDGKPVKDIPEPDATDVFFRFVSPFTFPKEGWRISTYSYVRLSINSGNANVLLNEVVFRGEKLDSEDQTKGTGEYCAVRAEIYDATYYAGQSSQEAKERARALIDSQRLPGGAASSFDLFSKSEVYSLKAIAEMRLGGDYAAGADGTPLDTYIIDGVYGALGNDILALGTLMFGMSPFGLRFFPMLAAFGALVVLERLVVRLTKSEKAGFVFSLLYALSCLTLGYGHIGTPLFLGVFFFACALDLVHRFYANGIAKANFLGVLPLLCAGIFGALAICVNGAFVIPVAGVVGLFIAGMVRQQQAKKYRLEKVLAEEEPSVQPAAAPAAEEESLEQVPETKEQRAGRVVSEFRFKNTAAPLLFFSSLVLGVFLFALLGMLPAYATYMKAFDNPADPQLNVFALSWQTFAGAFTGSNAYGGSANWLFETVFRGEGPLQAVTLAVINPIALVAGVFGICYTVARFIVLLCRKERDKAWRAEMRRSVILLAGLLLAAVSFFAVKTGGAFILLAYLFSFMLAANYFGAAKTTAAERVVGIVGLSLLALCFVVLAVFTFSVPLPEAFITAIFG